MSKNSEIEFPCVVNIRSIGEDEVKELTEAFVKLGACNIENADTNNYDSWSYYGVDCDKTTRFWDTMGDYSDKGDPYDVTVYTYEEVTSLSKTSSEALQDTLEEKATEVLAKGENGLESNTGASVNISVLVSVQGNNYQLSRDAAYKLWEDLTEIFEEKIV